MYIYKLFLVSIVVSILSVTTAQSSVCQQAKTCSECIQVDPECAWCSNTTFGDSGFSRCDRPSTLIKNGCGNSSISQPKSHLEMIVRNEPVSNAVGAKPAVQLQPQEVVLNLKPGEPAYIDLTVRQAEDYPVDLYYVMDLSNSMKDDLDKLKNLGSQLAGALRNITSSHQLGFGSFVDKTVMPFVSTVPSKLVHPCDGCGAPYGFKNVLPLNSDSELFTRTVRMQESSGNLDAPEGGMDALMQITVCKSEIKWRDNARRLVIYTSDAAFHYSGDGKLGGIVTPNDGKCHTANGLYTMSTELDYPSISQLNNKMKENNIIPIFAVTSSQMEVYNELTKHIQGATAGELALDSSNVVELVEQNYKKITSKVELSDNAPENVRVDYVAYCLGNQSQVNTKSCGGLSLGQSVKFKLAVTLSNCDDNSEKRVVIKQVGFSEELTIRIQPVCSCGCETSKEIMSEVCSDGNGTLVCGGCQCNPGRYGRLCECSSNDATSRLEDNDKACAIDNSTSATICSGRGSCVCGECSCFPRLKPGEVVSGKYCECDNFSCDRHNNMPCGGPEKGECICDEELRRSRCKCKPGYDGDACNCATSKEECISANGLICNNAGTCECGVCKCNASYTGNNCGECPTCPGPCITNKDCVQCKAFGEGAKSAKECDLCPYEVEILTNLTIENKGERCVFKDQSDCSFVFTYKKNADGTYKLKVQEDKVCSEPVDPLLIILGIVIGIIIVGLILLLVWRLLTYIHDKREFAKHEQERKNAKWGAAQNPIYKPSTSTYKNPMYRK
ncbi:integrin beta-1-like [Anneissia japonica]|uniref:integrin beta-1-like n=1 Tax=Anneissia japonica TaxID=1529436 RepID=UPI001425A26C|nr:integrin beta-1-like [Anneissia japonica]